MEAVEAKTRYTDNPDGTVTARTTATTTTSKLQVTAAVTTGTVALDAKVGDVEVGGVIKQQETDVIGFRENEFMLGGENRNGDYVERTGLSGGMVVSGGFEGTAVNGERTTEEDFIAVPFLKNSMVTDVKSGTQELQQSIELFGVTLGAGVVGIDAGLTIKDVQTTVETTTVYKGDMGLTSGNGNSSQSSGITWGNVSAGEAAQLTNYIRSLK